MHNVCLSLSKKELLETFCPTSVALENMDLSILLLTCSCKKTHCAKIEK